LNFIESIERLRLELGKELPGKDVQYRMAPSARNPDMALPKNDLLRRNSGVLILLYPFKNDVKIVFIKRACSGGPHSGQIALPGGKHEAIDKNLIQTALREAVEEIGVNHDDIIVLGTLTSLFIPVSNIAVLPVVGWCDHRPDFIKDNVEVDEILEINLNHLADLKNKMVKKIRVHDFEIDAPCYMINDYCIWGATAMIMSEFLELTDRAEIF
jgi:8-oxo-dGTP pyrophosphatase MutT (NUDIX family)